MRLSIKNASRKLKQVLKTIVAITKNSRFISAFLLIKLGEKMLGTGGKYRLIIDAIEDLLRSQDIKLQVTEICEGHPLTTDFIIRNFRGAKLDFDTKYFIREFALQLGCRESDIAIEKLDGRYVVMVTNTAIENLEQGLTQSVPKLLSGTQYDPLLKKAGEVVVKEGKASASLIAKSLDITYDRAVELLGQLEASGLITPSSGSKPGRVLN